jgi:small subunit ribosomal protein S3Ae
MAKAAKKGKSVDTWKLKKKYEVIAPDIFNNVPLGPIFAKEPEQLIGRSVETSLSSLVNSNQHHIRVTLIVTGTEGFNATTSVKSVELARSYITSQTNPGSDVIENIFRTKTMDGRAIRVKTLMFTRTKAHSGQKKTLRAIAEGLISDVAANQEYDRFVQETVFGKLGSLIFNKGKNVVPLGRVEIRKIELIKK